MPYSKKINFQKLCAPLRSIKFNPTIANLRIANTTIVTVKNPAVARLEIPVEISVNSNNIMYDTKSLFFISKK